MERATNVSVDLDGLGCYHSIHGIEATADPTAIYRLGLPRFLDFFKELGACATFFVIAEDLEHPEVVRQLELALDAGHEVASHSWRHRYDMRKFSDRWIHNELEQAERRFRDLLDLVPSGFRTPGYNVDGRLLRILAERGYRYDSSVFPCPPYYVAKGAVLCAMAIAGRESGTSAVDANALRAPLGPYRPGRREWWRPSDGTNALPLWEVPIGVIPGVRLPVIGTALALMPKLLIRSYARTFKRSQDVLQVEFHGIDMLDARDDCLHPSLIERQADLSKSLDDKRAAYRAFLGTLSKTHPFETLDQITRRLDSDAVAA